MFPKGLKSQGIPSTQIDIESFAIDGIAIGPKDQLYVADADDERIDVLPARPTSYDPIRSLSSNWPTYGPNSIVIGP